MAHTETPWHVGGNGTIIYSSDGWGIASATVTHTRQEPQTSLENARRIVAAVNATADIPIEQLEAMAKNMAETMKFNRSLSALLKNQAE